MSITTTPNGAVYLQDTTNIVFFRGSKNSGDPATKTLIFGSEKNSLLSALSSLEYRPRSEYHGEDDVIIMLSDLGMVATLIKESPNYVRR